MANKNFNVKNGLTAGNVTIYAANSTISTVNLAVSGNSNVGSISNLTITGGSSGQVLATYGNGSLYWSTAGGGSGSSISNGTSNVNIPSANGNVNISASGNANVLVVTGTGANVAGTLSVSGNAVLGNITTGSGSGGNISGANNISANTFTGVLTTSAQPNITSVGTLTSLAVNGTVTAVAFTANTGGFTGNGSGLSAIAGANVTGTVANATYATSAGTATSATSATTAGTVTTNAQPNITSIGTLTALNVSGNILFTGSNVSLGSNANVKITGGTNGYVLSTDGTGNLSWISAGAGNTAYVYTQSTPATTWVINHNLGYQYVNIQVIDSTGNSFTGRYNYPTIKFNNTTHCTVTFDSAQSGYAAVTSGGGAQGPEGPPGASGGGIISNGTSNVSILTSGGNITAGVGGIANIAVITSTGVNVNGTLNGTGNANVGNIGATNGVFTNVSGNGANLSSITGANVTGTVANATYATSAGSAATATSATTAGSSTTAGTVTTNAQPNITSVGTLTSLGVNGTVTATAFTANTGVFTGNGSGLSAIAGANVTGTVANATYAVTAGSATTATSATTAGTVTTAAQPNITSVGTLTSLAVTGNVSAANFVGIFANGTSDISIPAANGNINFDIGGVSNVFVIAAGGAITSANLADAVGYKGIPQNARSAQYTLALSDMGKHIDITTGGVVIPANSSVAFPIGATIVIFNDSASTQTISITTDTLRQAGTTNTGTRTLAAYGIATLLKVAATVWVVSGNVT